MEGSIGGTRETENELLDNAVGGGVERLRFILNTMHSFMI